MQKPFDVSKFRQSITKNIDGISIGFHDPKDWISTGNYTLNYLISGDFEKGVPLGKVSIFAGQSGSGKSFVCSGNIARNAQEMGCQVILFDSENALDEEWLKALNVDTDEEKLTRINVSMINDVAKTLYGLIDGYKKEYQGLDYEEMPKILIVIDSLGMLLTPTDDDQFSKGDMKGDMGRKPKMLGSLVRNMVSRLAPYPIAMVMTNHTYASQDMFDPDDRISGGAGQIYASSIVVAMNKLKLKEDESGNKTSEVHGIRAACKVMKSRFSKPFESVQVKIPYATGMDANSGLVDLFEKKGALVKTGNKLEFKHPNGQEELKLFRKQWETNHEGCLDTVREAWEDVQKDLDRKEEIGEETEENE